MKMLAMDPGDTNFGWAALKFSRQAVRVLRCGMLDDTIKGLKESLVLQEDADQYIRRVAWLLNKSGAEIVAAERYVPRRQGLSNESVNMMLGAAVSYCSTIGIPCSLFLAATWKLRVKKVLEIEQLYKWAAPVPNHVVDAVFIGLFAAEGQGKFKMTLTLAQQKRLCRDIQRRFLDLRTGKRKYKPKPKKRRRYNSSSRHTSAQSRQKR